MARDRTITTEIGSDSKRYWLLPTLNAKVIFRWARVKASSLIGKAKTSKTSLINEHGT